MPERWRPTGTAQTRVVVVDKTQGADADSALKDVFAQAQELLKGSSQESEDRSQGSE
jgi:hypothetical protein